MFQFSIYIFVKKIKHYQVKEEDAVSTSLPIV